MKIKFVENASVRETLEAIPGLSVREREMTDLSDLTLAASETLSTEVTARFLEKGSLLVSGIAPADVDPFVRAMHERGFWINVSGDMALARRDTVKKKSKTKVKSAAKKEDAEDTTPTDIDDMPIRLKFLREEWALKAARKFYKEFVGTDDLQHYLQFIRDLDKLISHHRDLNDVEEDEDPSDDNGKKKGKNEHADNSRTHRDVAAALPDDGEVVKIPKNVLDETVRAKDLEVTIPPAPAVLADEQ